MLLPIMYSASSIYSISFYFWLVFRNFLLVGSGSGGETVASGASGAGSASGTGCAPASGTGSASGAGTAVSGGTGSSNQ